MTETLNQLNKFLNNTIFVKIDLERAKVIFDSDKGQSMINNMLGLFEKNLSEELKKEGPLTEETKANIFAQILMMLEAKNFIKINIE